MAILYNSYRKLGVDQRSAILRYSGRSVNEDHVRYLKAHRKMGFFVLNIEKLRCRVILKTLK